jgi:hypothetical protein
MDPRVLTIQKPIPAAKTKSCGVFVPLMANRWQKSALLCGAVEMGGKISRLPVAIGHDWRAAHFHRSRNVLL